MLVETRSVSYEPLSPKMLQRHFDQLVLTRLLFFSGRTCKRKKRGKTPTQWWFFCPFSLETLPLRSQNKPLLCFQPSWVLPKMGQPIKSLTLKLSVSEREQQGFLILSECARKF